MVARCCTQQAVPVVDVAEVPPRARGRATPSSSTLLIVGPALIWGSSYLFIAEGLKASAPMGITFTRMLIGFLVLSCFPGSRASIRREDRGGVALLAVVWLAFPMSMFPFAEQHVSSALTGMLNAATPLFTAIVAAIIARRLPTRSAWIALGVGLTGAVVIALPSLTGGNDLMGIALILAALASYGFALNLARPLQQRNGALPIIWRSVGLATLLVAPFGARPAVDAHWTIGPILAMLALGGLGTGIANVLVATSAGRSGATRASSMAYLMPAVSLVLGVVVRDEHVAMVSVAGGVICVLGAWLLARAAKQ